MCFALTTESHFSSLDTGPFSRSPQQGILSVSLSCQKQIANDGDENEVDVDGFTVNDEFTPDEVDLSLNRPARASRAQSQSPSSDSRNERQRAICSKELCETSSKSPGQRATELQMIDFDRRLRDPQAHGPWTVASARQRPCFKGGGSTTAADQSHNNHSPLIFESNARCR